MSEGRKGDCEGGKGRLSEGGRGACEMVGEGGTVSEGAKGGL